MRTFCALLALAARARFFSSFQPRKLTSLGTSGGGGARLHPSEHNKVRRRRHSLRICACKNLTDVSERRTRPLVISLRWPLLRAACVQRTKKFAKRHFCPLSSLTLFTHFLPRVISHDETYHYLLFILVLFSMLPLTHWTLAHSNASVCLSSSSSTSSSSIFLPQLLFNELTE